jgi:ABC-type amino acid transport system permease subunit
MTITTTTRLTRAAGICAAMAGLIFIAVQIKHPPMDVHTVTTTQWVVRSTAKAGLRISTGCDGGQLVPVGLAGVEQ